MHIARLALTDFRSYHELDLALSPGATVLVGSNGQGKTNIAEAINYLATLSSHRVAQDAAMVRAGCDSAVVRALLVREGRSVALDVQITPGRANKARINRSPATRVRDILGIAHVVVFSPEDLALVKGDPSDRRRFLDELLVQQTPRLAGVRQEYDKIVRQRTALLKSAAAARGRVDLSTLDAWDQHLAAAGAQIMRARAQLVAQLAPLADQAYQEVAGVLGSFVIDYRTTVSDHLAEQELAPQDLSVEQWNTSLLAGMAGVRDREIERGVCLVGPHRDDLGLTLGGLPAKGYASHGESWSVALALRLASFDVLAADGQDEPILILDDVFAELDTTRRASLIRRIQRSEQVIITAAVRQDVPPELQATWYEVRDGQVSHVPG